MKKRGFTLVELLAVIVILAVIVLIATPIILNVIKNTKDKSLKLSVVNYIDAVEKTIVTQKSNADNNIDYSGVYTINKDVITKKQESAYLGSYLSMLDLSVKIKVKGTLPETGELEINEKGIVTWGKFMIGGTSLLYEDGKVTTDNSDSADIASLKTEINNLKADLDEEKDKGATIILTYSGSASMTCNSTNNKVSTLTQYKKTENSDDIFVYDDSAIVIKKAGYYNISGHMFVKNGNYVYIGLRKNTFNGDFSGQSVSVGSDYNPSISVSTNYYINENEVISLRYWCQTTHTLGDAKLSVTYLHS